MAVKEIPINYRVYYKSMKAYYTQQREEALSLLEDLEGVANKLYKSISDNIEVYKKEFNIVLTDYEEFVTNTYIDGIFVKLAKGAFINRKNNYLLVSDLFDLYTLAKKQKEIYELKKDIDLYDRILKLSMSEYNKVLKIFYTEVHKHMILKGEGYVFEDCIGWTCINRCHINKQAPHIDYAATKKKKAQLLAEGKRIYNKEEAEWYKKNGLEYDAVDGRVYMRNEYCYEIPLLHCTLPNGSKYKLDITDYRVRELRGKSNEQLAKECDNNLEDICELGLDLRTKLNMCVDIDKTLYTNFIRNENQKPINVAKINRKD